MKIIKLDWISIAGKEAELIVSDGYHECLAFSQPCNVKLNQNIMEPLHAMGVRNLMKVIDEDSDESIKKTNKSYFSHYCIAKVFRTGQSIVSVGDILIDLEDVIPSWAETGDLVEFQCSRLDIW